jgi:hypothetical protein
MTQPAKGQEPSMEEILASIRRIIADDDPAGSSAAESSLKADPAAALQRPPPPTRMASPPPDAPPTAALPQPAVPSEEIDPLLRELQASAAREAAADSEPASGILDLTEQMAEPEPRMRDFQAIERISASSSRQPPSEPPRPIMTSQHKLEPPRRQAAERSEPSLMSAATTAAVDSAFNSLAQTVLVQNGRTLEDLVKEMLRPLLKAWLDDNLPSLVERLVRAEIERVSRGR